MTKGLALAVAFVLALVVGHGGVRAQDEPAPTPAVETAPADASAGYDLQIHELEEQLNDLKEDVFASKARLRMIWHQLMEDPMGGSRIVLGLQSRLGGLFNVVRVNIALDGNVVFSATAEEIPEIDGRRRYEVVAQPVLPGPHTLVVQAELMGDPHGIFAYMREYVYSLVSSHSFIVGDGKTANVDIVLADEGGASRELDERLNVRYEMEFVDTLGDVAEGDGADTEDEGEARR